MFLGCLYIYTYTLTHTPIHTHAHSLTRSSILRIIDTHIRNHFGSCTPLTDIRLPHKKVHARCQCFSATLAVEASEAIDNVKAQMQDTQGVPQDTQRWILPGIALDASASGICQ